MQLSLIDIFLSDGAARAVCWTLIHSLWEGVLAAVLAGLIISCTLKLPAALRYNLLAADLLLFLLITGATFFYELRQEDRLLAVGVVRMTEGGADRLVPGSGGRIAQWRQEISMGFTRPGNFIQRAGDYLNTHAAVVTLFWLACLSGQMLRLTFGLYQARRLRRDRVAPPGKYWEDRLLILTHRLGIKRTVRLLQSGLVQAPAALGFLKPSILVPLGLLSNLPPDQVETVLLHELAHIRRGDYVANLLLHLTEAIFFFNPGARWIATLIRREREACCDDMVLAGTPDRNSYFGALVTFTQLAIDRRMAGERSLTLPLDGGKTDLLWRIRRMLDQENKKLQIMEKAILSFGLMVIVSVSLIGMKGKDRQATNPGVPLRLTINSPLQVPAMQPKSDTTPQQQGTTETIINFTSLTVHSHEKNGQKKYNAQGTDNRGNHYYVRMLNDKVVEFKVNGELIPKEDHERYSDVFDEIRADQKGHHAPAPPVAPDPPVERLKPVEPVGPLEPVGPEPPPTLANPLVYTKEPNPYIKKIAIDLVENRLIDHVDELSFTLDADGLIVNGVRQSEDVYLKFKAKYIRHPKDHFIYSQYYTPHGSGSHAEVKTDDDSHS